MKTKRLPDPRPTFRYKKELDKYFYQIYDIKIGMDTLFEKMSPLSEKQICSEIIVQAERATKIANRVLQLIPVIGFDTYTISASGTHMKESFYHEIVIDYSRQLMDMMFNLEQMEAEAKKKLFTLEQNIAFRQALNEYAMPNINHFTSTVTFQLRDVINSEQPDLSRDKVTEILKLNSTILADELYNAEKDSVTVQQLNGMRFHYQCLMSENEEKHHAIEAMDSERRTMCEEKAKLDKTIKKVKSQMALLQEEQQTLSVSVQELTQANQLLKNANTSLTQRQKRLSVSVQELMRANQLLNNTNTSLTQEQQTLSVAVQELTQANQLLNNTNASLTQGQQTLSACVQEMTEENQLLKNTNTELNQKIENLNVQLEVIKAVNPETNNHSKGKSPVSSSFWNPFVQKRG